MPRAHRCSRLAWLALVCAACRSAPPPPADSAPPPAAEPAPTTQWLDPALGPERGAQFLALQDLHFEEYAGVRAPPAEASRILESLDVIPQALLKRGGSGAVAMPTKHCLEYSLPAEGLAAYEAFAKLAQQRGDQVSIQYGSIQWSRERQQARFEVIDGVLEASWCTSYPQAVGRESVDKMLASDWRFGAMREAIGRSGGDPSLLLFGRDGQQIVAYGNFSLYEVDAIDRARTWLQDREFSTDALEQKWTTQVGPAAVTVENSDWSKPPVAMSIEVRTGLPVAVAAEAAADNP